MKKFQSIFRIGLLLCICAISQQTHGQCLSLELLDQAIASGRVTPDSLANILASSTAAWERQPGDIPSWILWQPQQQGDNATLKQPLACVSLRRSNEHTYYDLIYKTRQHACVAQVRANLKHRAKLLVEAATCLQCEAERLVGYGYSATLINQKMKFAAGRTDYPYVLVMRRDNSTEPVLGGDNADMTISSRKIESAH